MSRIKKKKHTAPKVIGLAVILAGGAGAAWHFGLLENQTAVETTVSSSYKEEKVL